MVDLRHQFLEEAQAKLVLLEEGFLKLEKGDFLPDVAALFRAAHSLKTAADALELPAATRAAHALEELLSQLRSERLAPSVFPAGLALRAVDLMARALPDPEQGAEMVHALAQLAEDLERTARATSPSRDLPPLPAEVLQVLSDYKRERLRKCWGGSSGLYLITAQYTSAQFYQGAKLLSDRLKQMGELISLSAYTRIEKGFDMAFVALLAGDQLEARDLEGLPGQILVSDIRKGKARLPGKPAVAPPRPASEPPKPEPPQTQASLESDPRFVALRTKFLDSIPDRMDDFTQKLLELEREPGSRAIVDDLFRVGHNLKGSGGTFLCPSLSQLGHAMETVLDGLRKGTLAPQGEVMSALLASADAARELARGSLAGTLQEGFRHPMTDRLEAAAKGLPPPALAAQAPAPRPIVATGGGDSMRVALGRIDHLINLSSELSILRGQRAASTRRLDDIAHRLRVDARRWRASLEELEVGGASPALHSWAAALLAEIDALHEKLERFVEAGGREFGQIARTTDDLRNSLLALRMLPLANLFAGLPRLVRDTAANLSKDVDLEVEGADTEVDKRVLEELADPIIHLVRNAIDHGLESREDRARAGKSPRGKLRLAATHRGSQVVIDIQDDGRGLDVQAIRRKAVSLGMLTAGAAETLSDREAAHLIFEPGFTTRDQATTISGRGVGMDVVLASVRKLRGMIDLDWKPGAGTRFILTVPLTLSFMQTLRVRSGGEQFLIPAIAVLEAVRVRGAELELLDGTAVIEHRGSIVPVVPLGPLLGSPRPPPQSDALELVVVGASEKRIALAVEELVREETVVIKDCGRLVPSLSLVGGATIAEDGEVLLVLDMPGLMSAALASAKGRLAAGPRPAAVREPATVLVVDDVFATRELLRGLAEMGGYHVLTAQNGLEAMSLLGAQRIDVVLTDIEMPAMDGFELLRAIRSDARLSRLPVLLVTGRSTDEERQRGLMAGATAYLVKGQFDQRDLLRLIAREVG